MLAQRRTGILTRMSRLSGKKLKHPFLAMLRALSAKFPETSEVEAWGHPTFRVDDKIFASFGEHEGEPSIGCKQTRPDQAVLVEDPRFHVAPYVGRYGWIGIKVDQVKWPLVAELVEQSYRLVAPKRLVAKLDESLG